MADKAQNFDFELVSPEKKLMSEKAWQVTIPGYEGDFGVRANHSALVASIRPGVVSIIPKEGDKPTKIFIAGGFADVTADNCTILAEEAIFVCDLNKEEIEAAIQSLEEDVKNSKDEITRKRNFNKLRLAQGKLAALTNQSLFEVCRTSHK